MKINIILKILIILVLCFPMILKAQKDSTNISKNSIFFEFLGNGIFSSVKYDRLFKLGKHKMSFNVGAFFIPESDKYISGYSLPIELNLLVGKKSQLEFGIGMSYAKGLYTQNDINENKQVSESIYTAIKPIGYRLQKLNGGIFFRASVLFLYRTVELNKSYIIKDNELIFFPYLGISIGYTFRTHHSK